MLWGLLLLDCRWSFKGQKGDRIQHIGLTLIRRSGTSDPVSNPSYSSRVCAKHALKIWNAVELALFLKANLNPVVADVKATSDDCETQQHGKRKSKSSTSEEKPKSAKTPAAELESQASALRTPTTACFCSAFKGFSETIASWWSEWSAPLQLHDLHRSSFLCFCQLSVIGRILTNQVLRCCATEGLKSVRRVCRLFFLVSPSSPLGHTTLSLVMTKRSS